MPKIHLRDYKTTQTSGDTLIDTYWELTNYKLLKLIHRDYPSNSLEWLKADIVRTAQAGINMCEITLTYYPDNRLVKHYLAQFRCIIKDIAAQ